jgi:diguanylate cyclase (GGDEF)-like protein
LLIHIDAYPLLMLTIYVEAILGLLLLFAWAQNSAIHGVEWWGFAHLIRAGSIMLFGMYGSAPDLITIDLANALLFTSFAVTWTGARVFDGRPAEPVHLVAGAVLWFLISRLPVLAGALEMRALITTGIITTYTWLTAYEFWRGRSEPLVSRWPAIFMLFAHGSLFLLRTPLIALLPRAIGSHVYGSVWLTVISTEALLFSVSIAFILLAMAKERNELHHRIAAMVDPLTGIANRRAFMENAAQLAKRHRANPRPTAVLLIDLDHFKSINDRFGHAFGDQMLVIFADTARQSVRSTDLLGRVGGEEFAVLLPDMDRKRALAVAERIRANFAQAGLEIGATVSIGLAHCRDAELNVPELLAWADQALYCAKENGRNRIEIASQAMMLKSKYATASTTAVTAMSRAPLIPINTRPSIDKR